MSYVHKTENMNYLKKKVFTASLRQMSSAYTLRLGFKSRIALLYEGPSYILLIRTSILLTSRFVR